MTKALGSDIAAIARIDAVPSILEIACRITGLRFAAVARVTDTSWTACAVRDEIGFGLGVGGSLDLKTTICDEIRDSGQGVIIDHVAYDPVFRDHHTPRQYGFESYISIPILRKDGSFFGTLCALDPLPAKLSNPGIIATFENFAQLIGLQLDLQDDLVRKEDQLLEAGQTAEIRERFIAILGHDLRNPVAAIEAGITMLGRTQTDEKSGWILTQLLQSTRRISLLINDLLDFARGRLGSGLTLRSVLVPRMSVPIEQVIAELQIVHPDRIVDLNLKLEEAVTCDVERITQLVSNLVGNALTHGAVDEPIAVTATSAGGTFTLSVSNGGTPIPDEVLPTLFQPFTQSAEGQSANGLGLGLFIASEIAKAHGGSIEVSSSDEGTRFKLTMPCSC
ncbi:GAF domain-containing sensor histidine kinase [Novosphingobium resinovorum]|uniref:histidine kinase n=1 Tax=Novosphingobium resinovorum TaxID=158500 RepID=A0A1D8AF04_9SPHN|nr:GAF domain-containing sensor histidine kinase [Novosphingobium resinovorum]AOR80704.1 histidine kinase [Novosphingobium resinovorum]